MVDSFNTILSTDLFSSFLVELSASKMNVYKGNQYNKYKKCIDQAKVKQERLCLEHLTLMTVTLSTLLRCTCICHMTECIK